MLTGVLTGISVVADELPSAAAGVVTGPITWGSPTLVDPSHSPTSVSCPSSTFCVTVGDSGNALTWNGSSWSSRVSIDPNETTSVSCRSSSFCVAVDVAGFALIGNGTVASISISLSVDIAEVLGSGGVLVQNPTCNHGSWPINCPSGNFWHTFTDFSIPGLGPSLSLTRTYNAQGIGSSPGPFGYGWSCSYCMNLTFNSDGSITFTYKDGSQATAEPAGNGWYAFPSAADSTLVKNADGTYSLVFHQTRTYTFNAGGQLISISDPIGNQTSLSYNSSGYLASVTAASGRSLSFTTNSTGLVTSVTDPMGNTIDYTYDSASNLVSVTEPNGGVWNYTYDSSHLMTGMENPIGGTVTNTYDSEARVISQTNPSGDTTTYSYGGDAFSTTGGTTTITYPDGQVELEDYVQGDLISITKGEGTPEAATTTFSYGVTSTGTYTTITDPTGNVTTMTYDANGNLTGVTPPSSTTSSLTMSYDSTNALLTETATDTSAGLSFFDSWGRNADGLIASSNSTGNPNYTYSYNNRLQDTQAQSNSYTYSPGAEIQSITPNGGTTSTYNTYNQAGELCLSVVASVSPSSNCSTVPTGATTYTYDANGNRTSTTPSGANPTTYGWNPYGNMSCLTSPNTSGASCTSPNSTYSTTYTYNGDGLRMSQTSPGGTTEQFTWNTLSSVPQLLMDGSNAYIYGPQGTALGTAPVEQISTGSTPTVSYLMSDPTGVRAQISSSGVVVGEMSYSPYGTPCSITQGCSLDTPFGYAGGYTDPTGLIYLINRYYDPSTGQFLSVDPLVAITGEPYAYVGGDPVNLTDPLGLCNSNIFSGSFWTQGNCLSGAVGGPDGGGGESVGGVVKSVAGLAAGVGALITVGVTTAVTFGADMPVVVSIGAGTTEYEVTAATAGGALSVLGGVAQTAVDCFNALNATCAWDVATVGWSIVMAYPGSPSTDLVAAFLGLAGLIPSPFDSNSACRQS